MCWLRLSIHATRNSVARDVFLSCCFSSQLLLCVHFAIAQVYFGLLLQLGPYKVKCMLAEPKTKRNRVDAGPPGLFTPHQALAQQLYPWEHQVAS